MCRHVSGLKNFKLEEPRSGAIWKKYEVIKETEMGSEERKIFKIKGEEKNKRKRGSRIRKWE